MQECFYEYTKGGCEPCSPVKRNENDETSPPWTPTSNFKLLLKAISPDLRNKDSFGDGFLSKTTNGFSCGEQRFMECTKRSKLQMYDRKEKSLGVLCQKFLSIYSPFPPANTEICLKDAADLLGVGRRRVYDIINVMESIELTTRLAKNKYLWLGKNHLSSVIKRLKKQALEEGLDKKLEKFWNTMELREPRVKKEQTEEPDSSLYFNFGADETKKSLSALSQKFLMMFLVSKDHTLHLEMGARVLLDDPYVEKGDASKFKTMIRRLYDIANIMTTLELITKVQSNELKHRKPFYKYIGPSSDDNDAYVCNVSAQVNKAKKSFQKCLSFDQICEAASAARNSMNAVISQASLESVPESCSSDGNSAGKFDNESKWRSEIKSNQLVLAGRCDPPSILSDRLKIGAGSTGIGSKKIQIFCSKPVANMNSVTTTKGNASAIKFIPYKSCTLKRFCDDTSDTYPKKVIKLIIKKEPCSL